MRVGDIIRLKKLDVFPRPPAPGSQPRYRVDRYKCELVKGKVYVAVLLGAENLDGSEAIDTDAQITKLAHLQPGDRDPTTLKLLEKLKRYEDALASIRKLPDQFGHFSGALTATEAIRIAKEALS